MYYQEYVNNLSANGFSCFCFVCFVTVVLMSVFSLLEVTQLSRKADAPLSVIMTILMINTLFMERPSTIHSSVGYTRKERISK